MDAIQGAKNRALFREAANERLRDLDEAFERVMGKPKSQVHPQPEPLNVAKVTGGPKAAPFMTLRQTVTSSSGRANAEERRT